MGGILTYWLISKQPAHGLWVKFLHTDWYQSSLHMGYGSNSYILADIKAACTWAMGETLTYWLISEQPAHGRWVKFLHINWYQSSCTWAMDETLTYWLISKQPVHGLWVEFLHTDWYQSSLYMGYGSNSYILTDIKAACTWAMDQILTYWLISKQPAHGLWVKLLHINCFTHRPCAGCSDISQYVKSLTHRLCAGCFDIS